MSASFDNRVTRMLGVEIPIVQAPMGWIARSQLASAVSNAGAMGIIETSSGELDNVREEIRRMRDLTDKPFGVNIAQAFVRDPSRAAVVVDPGGKVGTPKGGGPSLVHVRLDRYFGHFEGDAMTYRAPGEVEGLRERVDCLKLFRQRVLEAALLEREELDRVDDEVTGLIDEATAEAKGAPPPTEADLLTDVYVAYH